VAPTLTDDIESVGGFRMPEMIAAETGKILAEQEAYFFLIGRRKS
jgi:hypothetical protein